MGNQLVGVAPSQIYPVEHYLMGSFESDLQFESSMGSTRFFKVARAKSDEGLIVVKVFVKHDPSLPLEVHAERLEYIKKNLSNAVNCLPFQRVELTDKAGLVMREYVKHSLYDKVSTRPFLTTLEKKWITFQVLCALHQCHKQKICHGDIKLENILITSWNWILLADFASFKPTYLPEDNPADYTYFFDTSRRRTCYIAPERFVKSYSAESIKPDGHSVVNNKLMTESIIDESFVGNGPGNLLPEMDIFSAGCALLELWSEGTAPFEFSQLLAYRAGEMELVKKHLKEIENENLRNLIASMISRNPKERKSAEIYLDQERGHLFPEYFYSFLQSYIQMFSSIPIRPADDKILLLHSDIKQIIKILTKNDNNDVDDENVSTECNGLIIITTVVTSCIRGLQHCITKIRCLEILKLLSENTTSETILDRILPYILHLANDQAARVRVCALHTLTACLGMVKDVPRSDANVFPEYVLPLIAPLASDASVVVRVAYAQNISTLAETAVRFLEQTQLKSPTEMPGYRYESELSALHEMLQQTVSSLLTDPHPIVKQTLMESGITKLCVFFGRQKANDLILSHMITFLNDKEDTNLRGTFFDCIVGVAAFVGWQCSDILIPLLQQGLTDLDEFVVAKSIRATTALTELGLIQKNGLTEFISDCACYLNHPNLWIRHEIVGLISTAANTFNAIDVQCKIMPAISNHLKAPLIQVEKPEILFDCLYPPIPRNIFDSVVKFSDINQLIRILEERRVARESVADGVLPQYGDMNVALRNLFRRLSSESLNDLVETQLLSLKSYLIKLNKYKAAENKRNSDGKICLADKTNILNEYSMIDKTTKFDATKKHRKIETENLNSEWHHMFGGGGGGGACVGGPDQITSPSSPSNDSTALCGLGNSPASSATNIQATPTSSLVEYSMPERSFLQEQLSECRKELESLRNKVKNRYQILASTKDFHSSMLSKDIPSTWQMKGTLVAHLHEHKSAVTKLTSLKPNSNMFASCSTDGTVRLWDCNKLDGYQSINRSRQMYFANMPIYSIAACDNGQSLAVSGKDGTVLLLRIDSNSSKMALQEARHMDSCTSSIDDGPIIEMQPLEQGSQSLIVYTTLYGSIVCWDLRMPQNAWRLRSPLRHGVLTTFCIDPTSSWMATGTSGGKHICWDLRFRLPIAEIRHPFDSRIRKVVPHPTEPSWLISSSHGNNEVSIWNVETGHRQAALWASNAPPLSKETNANANIFPPTVCGLVAGTIDQSPFILTGSSDQRLRFWDLSAPKNCSIVVPAARENLSESNFSYESRLIDGTHVIYEVQNTAPTAAVNTSTGSGGSTSVRNAEEQQPRSGPELPAPGHHGDITDLLLCKTQKQTFIASSSRDGVIKLWK